MSTEKEPFEKIRSLVERRKLFQSLVDTLGEIHCKGDGDALFTFVPVAPDNKKLILGPEVLAFGALKQTHPIAEGQLVLGHFSVEPDRYFLKGTMRSSPKGEGHVFELNAESEIFKLQRRKTFRVQLPSSFPIYFKIKTCDRKSLDLDIKVADLSAGGMRVYSPDYELPFKDGTEVVGTLYPPSSRAVDLVAVVKHIRSAVIDNKLLPQFGVEIVNPSPTLKNRLISLTLDFQHRIVTRYGGSLAK